ncbi:hypothetical protein EK0264_02495 [Epidermidibacterium keratini]|uniref:PRC-barrel domain containing protein n=1 Tax=Epidermidibacterium keratini TaxID=1891644 RepID=A0A7L4YJK2_9ACTN|nr:hypothetical protein [Epidermidibacterium keratini]QHB99271.1 hypothetical protein EK0264_02495 [Epidermidibacterium keratini]
MPGRRDHTEPHNVIDANLHLLDRQIVDSDGLLAGKVNDLELTIEDGRVRVTGILAGLPALLPRFASGDRQRTLLEAWRMLGVTRADRLIPGRIEVSKVECLDSAVHLNCGRDEVAVPDEPQPSQRRLTRLTDMNVQSPGARRDRVLDARFSRANERDLADAELCGLIVGPDGRPGSLLGYDRTAEHGPAPVARFVRWVHRHARYLPYDESVEIDWDAKVIATTARSQFRPLTQEP